jgi:hypothetical protein
VLLDTSPSGIAARSMQRRLQQQRSTIRLLMILMGLLLIVAIVVIGVMITRLARVQSLSSAQPAGAGGGRAATSAPTAPERPVLQQAPSDSDSIEGSSLGGAPAGEASATATMPDDQSDVPAPAVENATSTIDGDHEHAQALLVAAKKEARPLKDRIKDCDAAAGLLKAIKARAKPAELPPNLDQEIMEADRLLERLKLQEFFP